MPVDSVIARIPGLGGYEAARQQGLDEEAANLKRQLTLAQLLQQKRQLDMEAAKGQSIGAGGLRLPSGEIIAPVSKPVQDKHFAPPEIIALTERLSKMDNNDPMRPYVEARLKVLSSSSNERPYFQFPVDAQGRIMRANARTGAIEPAPVASGPNAGTPAISLHGPAGQAAVGEKRETGQELGKYTGTVMKDAAAAGVANRYVANLEAAVKDFTPGKLAPIQNSIVNWAQSVGVPVSAEDRKAAGSIQTAFSIGIKLAGQATRQSDAQPSQLQFLKNLESMPSEQRTIEGFNGIVSYMRDINNYQIFKHEELQKWRQGHNGSAEGFEAAWPEISKSLPLVWNQQQPVPIPKTPTPKRTIKFSDLPPG